MAPTRGNIVREGGLENRQGLFWPVFSSLEALFCAFFSLAPLLLRLLPVDSVNMAFNSPTYS